MMSRLSWMLLMLMQWLVSSPVRADINHTVSNSVVQIRGLDPQGRMYYGSGVVTEPGRVATNCHVVRNGGKIGVYRGGESYRATAERADVHKDLCLLEVPGIGSPHARLGRGTDLRPQQTLYFYGYPRALGMSFSEGIIKKLIPFGGSRIIETSAFFTLGGSGGGLFDRRGKLVGLATFLSPGHSGQYYAVPSDWITRLKSQPARAIERLQGLSFWEDAASLPTFLKRP